MDVYKFKRSRSIVSRGPCHATLYARARLVTLAQCGSPGAGECTALVAHRGRALVIIIDSSSSTEVISISRAGSRVAEVSIEAEVALVGLVE